MCGTRKPGSGPRNTQRGGVNLVDASNLVSFAFGETSHLSSADTDTGGHRRGGKRGGRDRGGGAGGRSNGRGRGDRGRGRGRGGGRSGAGPGHHTASSTHPTGAVQHQGAHGSTKPSGRLMMQQTLGARGTGPISDGMYIYIYIYSSSKNIRKKNTQTHNTHTILISF